MFPALIGWMGRDWASRKNNPMFAFGQRIVWGIPLFVSIGMIGILNAFDFPRDSSASLTVIALGAIGLLAIMLVSLYRWVVDYSRSDFQERAATEHRARVAARQAFFRSWLKRKGS